MKIAQSDIGDLKNININIEFAKIYAILIIFAVMLVAFSSFSEFFLTWNNVRLFLRQASILGIVAYGFLVSFLQLNSLIVTLEILSLIQAITLIYTEGYFLTIHETYDPFSPFYRPRFYFWHTLPSYHIYNNYPCYVYTNVKDGLW